MRERVEEERRSALEALADPARREPALSTLARLALVSDGDHERAQVYLSQTRAPLSDDAAVVSALVASARGDLGAEVAAWRAALGSSDAAVRFLAVLRLLAIEDFVPRPARDLAMPDPGRAGAMALAVSDLELALSRKAPPSSAARVRVAPTALPWSVFADGRVSDLLGGSGAPVERPLVDGEVALGCPGSCVARVELLLPPASGGCWLRVTSPEAFSVYGARKGAGDRRLATRDPTASHPAQAIEVWLPPEWASGVAIEVAASSAEPRIGVQYVPGSRGEPLPHERGWIGLLLAAERAAHRSDRDGAMDALSRLEEVAPRLVEGRLVQARALMARGPELRRLLGEPERLSRHAGAVRVLAAEARAAGRDEVAGRYLPALRRMEDPRAALEAFRILRDRGWEEAAEEELGRARRLSPSACEPAREAVMQHWTRLKLQRARLERDHLPAGCEKLPQVRSMIAQFEGEIGRKVQALERLDRESARVADPRAGGTERLRLLERLGRHDDLLALAGKLARDEPARALVEPQFQLGDLLAARGEPDRAARAFDDAARRGSGDRDVRLRLMALGAGRVWERFGPDVDAVASEEIPAELTRGQPAILLVDHHVSVRFRDGASIRHVHQLMRLLTPTAVEEMGEASLPDDSWVLRAVTRKADGRVLEPEEIVEKEALSFPDLEVGDAIELSYLSGVGADAELGGGFVDEPHYFQVFDIPTWRVSYVVLLQDGVEGQYAAHPAIAEPAAVRLDGFSGWKWTAQAGAALRAEPLAPVPLDVLPRVQAWSGLDWPDLVRLAREDLLRLVAPDGRMRLLAGRLAPADGDRRAGLAAVYNHVVGGVQEVEDAFLDVPAAESVQTGRGERAITLLGLLLAAGFDAQLALVSPIHRERAPWKVPDVRDFSYLAVRVTDPSSGEPMWLDPTFRGPGMGFLAPTIRGRPAWMVGTRSGLVGKVDTPREVPVGETRTIVAEVHVDGSLAVGARWREEARAMDAVVYRDGLVSMTEQQRLRAFGDLAQDFLPGARASDLRVDGLEPDAPSVRIGYDLVREGPRGAASGAGPHVLRLGLVPLMLSQRFVHSPSRETPLYANRNEDVDLTVEIALAPGVTPGDLPAAVRRTGPFGDYVREVTESSPPGGPRTLLVRKTFRLRPQVVPPGAYDAFRSFCRAVDEADRLELRLEPMRRGRDDRTSPP